MLEIKDYIANQLGTDYLDELQKMTICYLLKQNVALDGEPGIGKTESVLAFARIIGKEVFDKGCSEDTTENQIIGFPVLEEKNGATSTKYVDGPLTAAMRTGNIFYGDEFNLLRKDKQKRLNSAFDNRRYIIKSDNEKVDASPSFFSVISYNPSNTLIKKDLDESVADRFIHIHYNPLPKELLTYIALKKISGDIEMENITLETRGILFLQNKVLFFVKNSSGWTDFFTGKIIDKMTIEKIEPMLKVYKTFIPKRTLRHIPETELRNNSHLKKFAENLTLFTDCIRNLIDKGSLEIDKRIASNLPDSQIFTKLNAHRPSLRLMIAALQQYNMLIKLGMNPQLGRQYISDLCADCICFGQYRDIKVGELTTLKIVNTVAELYGLIPNSVDLTSNFSSTNSKLKAG